MMKPHGNAVLTQETAYFNFRLSRTRMVTEGAFGKLKGRFRVLHHKCESNKETVKIKIMRMCSFTQFVHRQRGFYTQKI